MSETNSNEMVRGSREESRRLHSYMQVVGKFGTGGYGKSAYNLGQALRESGVRVSCVALRERRAAATVEGTVERIGLGAGGGLFEKVKAGAILRGSIVRLSPDVVHVHGPQSLLFVNAVVKTLRHRPAVWFTWHDSENVLNQTGLRRRALVKALWQCERIFGASQSIVDRINTAIGLDEFASVLTNCVPDRGVTGSIGEEIPQILWAARLVPPKDPELIIRAAALLRTAGKRFRLVIAGASPSAENGYERRLKESVGNFGLQGIIDFPGWVDDLAPLLWTSAIAVQTSRSEGLSMFLLEAMMAGLAVVATDVGDTSRAIRHRDTGILVKSGDEVSIARHLDQLIQSHELRRSLGSQARKFAQDKFSFKAGAAEVIEVYNTSDSRARTRKAIDGH